MVVGAEKEEGDVGCGKTYEGYGSAVGGDDGGKQTCGEEEEVACVAKIDAEVGGVVVAEQDGVEGLGEQEGEDESEDAEGGEDGELLEGDSTEIAHAPDEKTLYVINGCEKIEEGDDGGGYVAHHDACDEEHQVVFEDGGEDEEQSHDEETAEECGNNDGERTCPCV